jgi:hypothetical protein
VRALPSVLIVTEREGQRNGAERKWTERKEEVRGVEEGGEDEGQRRA